jgi:hypothetical protein
VVRDIIPGRYSRSPREVVRNRELTGAGLTGSPARTTRAALAAS